MKIKTLVADNMLLAYYDRKKPVTLQCDYSENGIGVALVQDGKPVQFASKALVNGEEDYAPRNAWGCVRHQEISSLPLWTQVCGGMRSQTPAPHPQEESLSGSAAPAWNVKSCR